MTEGGVWTAVKRRKMDFGLHATDGKWVVEDSKA